MPSLKREVYGGLEVATDANQFGKFVGLKVSPVVGIPDIGPSCRRVEEIFVEDIRGVRFRTVSNKLFLYMLSCIRGQR